MSNPFKFEINDSSKNSGTILKDVSHSKVATDGGIIDKSIKLNEESNEMKDINRKSFKLNKKMLIWTIVGVLLAVLIALWPLIKKGLSF